MLTQSEPCEGWARRSSLERVEGKDVMTPRPSRVARFVSARRAPRGAGLATLSRPKALFERLRGGFQSRHQRDGSHSQLGASALIKAQSSSNSKGIATGVVRVVAPMLVAGCLLAGALRGESRALLVSVARVPGFPSVATLDGPDNDVRALREQLVADWGFSRENVRTLIGEKATKRAILDALDRLVDESSARDSALIYFSGHGVSAHERVTGTSGYGIDIRTGALLPTDVTPKSSESILAQLIVGARDLRPRFERLDAIGASTFVLIDACYSGDSAKSPPRLVPRSASLAQGAGNAFEAWHREFGQLLETQDIEVEWPYERVVYISAAARDELAFDISSELARGVRPTIDGLAHGVLTNGLLLALRGYGDRDRDGRITYSELHEFLVESVWKNGQTPQLHPRRGDIVDQPVLGIDSLPTVHPRAQSHAGPLRVRIQDSDAELRDLFADSPLIRLTPGEYDLEIRQRDDRYLLYLPSGSPIGVSVPDRSDLSDVVRRRASAHRIAGIAYPEQDMRLALLIDPDQGVYRRGEILRVRVRPGMDSWVVLLSIAPDGRIYVVHPSAPDEARMVRAGEEFEVLALGVVAPYGTDRLEAFAFREKPKEYARWIGRQDALEQADTERMLSMLSQGSGKPGRARASRAVFTRSRF